jgi:hypothetical protein
MDQQEMSLNEVQLRELQQQASAKGIHVDDLIREIIHLFLLRAGDITRFVAKKGRGNDSHT